MMQAEIENTLTKIWQTVLGLSDSIASDVDFYEAGGNSMQAMRIIVLIEEKFNINLTMLDFFEATTICQLTEKVKNNLC